MASNNTESHPNKPNIHTRKQDNLFDLNRIISLLKKNWYLFVISFPLCLGTVWIYHRYTVPVYQARATMLLKSADNKPFGQTDLMEGFGLSPEVRSVENQTFIIRSQKIVRRTIDLLDFAVTITKEGNFKDTELYGNTPFKIEFDSLHPQLVNVPIKLRFTNDGGIVVDLQTEGGWLHNYSESSYEGGTGAISFSGKAKVGEWIQRDSFKFKVTNVKGFISPDDTYSIIFKSHEYLTAEFRSSLGVSSYNEGSNIIFITSVGTNQAKIKRFLDVLCDVVLEHNLERKNNMATRSLDFIEIQLESIADTLEKVQNRLLTFRKSNRFMGPSEFSQKLAEQYFQAEKDLKLIEMQESYYQYIKENLSNAQGIEEYMLPAVDSENTGLVNTMVLQLIALEEEKGMLLNAAELDNHYLRSLDSKITVTTENLKRAINQVLKSCELEKAKVNRSMLELVGDMDQLPELEKSYLRIDRTFKLNDAIYTFLLQKHSETQIAKASNVPDNEVIDTASISAIVSPKKQSDYQKGLLFALLLPSLIIGLREYFNVKIRSREDVRHLSPDLPLMGMIMYDKEEVSNVIYERSNSIISESFRALRTKLKFIEQGNGTQIICLTSTNTGEGKTFCAHNLSSVFSISGKKTVLLGFDLRKPRLSEIFKLEDKLGLSTYLIGKCEAADVIYETQYENFSVVPAGPIPPNPSELIAGKYTKQLFDYLKERYEVIIIDSPPVGLVADARLLMEYSDYNLFVVRMNHTLKDHFSSTIYNLVDDQVMNVGLLLNDVSGSERGYGYYSAEYYGVSG